MIDVMSFGGGVQSTAIMTLAGEGLIPMPSRFVFSDPGFESEATYAHLERCKEYLAKRGKTVDIVSAGNIRADSLAFAKRSQNQGTKRYASIPMFVQNVDGTSGMLPRQCTTEYKIEPIEQYHRREVMGLQHGQRAPKTPTVNVWIGISLDECRRATGPGRWKEAKLEVGRTITDEPVIVKKKVWVSTLWQVKSFPLLGVSKWPDRSERREERFFECEGWDREDCLNWLAKSWPWPVPRSACICCPYRTNEEWRQMRDGSPAEWRQAVQYDSEIRAAYADGQRARGALAGVPYLHRSMIPLDQVDLSEPLNDRMGCGGLFSQEPDGICGV